jgi:hypothetical protein
MLRAQPRPRQEPRNAGGARNEPNLRLAPALPARESESTADAVAASAVVDDAGREFGEEGV